MTRRTYFGSIALLILIVCAPARAATVALSKLDISGIDDQARIDFQHAAEEGLAGARTDLAPTDKAAYRAEGSVKRDGARYELRLTLTRARDQKKVGEKSEICRPCTHEDAVKMFRLFAKTLSLAIPVEDESPPRPGLPSPPVPGPAPPRAIPRATLPAVTAPSVIEPTAQRSPPSVSVSAKERRFTAWYRALVASAFIPGLALGATGIVVGCNQGAPAGDNDCHTRNRVLAAGLGLTAVGHLVVVADLVNALGSSPRRPVGHTVLAWSSIAAGLALGAGSYLILSNQGYGQTGYRVLGYADAPLGAAAFAMGLGTLIAGPTTREPASLFLGPGAVGFRGRF